MTVPSGPLANTVWHALSTAQAGLAERVGGAARFPSDISPFAAISDTADPAAWSDLAELVGPGGEATLTGASLSMPAGWTDRWHGIGVQLVAGGRVAPTRPGAPVEIATLGPADAPEMADLVGRTKPGPWAARTQTLGPFFGVRDEGRLVGMAGTRFHLPPYREISAVCTDPDHRGRGLAGALVARVAEHIRDDGEIPFLHAVATNTGAIRLYRAMGFDDAHDVIFGTYRAPGA